MDRNRRQHRPALVVSAGTIDPRKGLLWVVMITSAGNEAWEGDVAIGDHVAAGLPVPSTIRPVKIATIEATKAETVGRVSPQILNDVMLRLRNVLRSPEH